MPDNMSDNETPPLEDQIKSQVQNTHTWVRLFFMALFMAIFYVVFFITGAVAIMQFVTRILTGKPLSSLMDFNAKLAEYARDLVAYITYASDAKPFPFKE
jgi:hypothetical protein